VVLLRILRCTAHHFSLAASRLEHSQLPPAAGADPELASARTVSKESKSSDGGDSKAGSDLKASLSDAGSDADSESKELAKAFAAHRQSMQRAGDGGACACVGCSAWAAEFRYLQSLQLKYPGHETLWYAASRLDSRLHAFNSFRVCVQVASSVLVCVLVANAAAASTKD
jgi:hypothetical protein